MKSGSLSLLLFLFSIKMFSTDYIFNGPGNWEDASLWTPSYPGLTILPDDTVTINGECTMTPISAINNEGHVEVVGELIVNGPAIYNNFIDATMTVEGQLIINKTMYNQGSLTINGEFYVEDIFINFNELYNNGTLYSSGAIMNNAGEFINTGTYIDNVGYFEQGITSHEGVWEGSAVHSNDEFIGNGGHLSPGGSDEIGIYTFSSDLNGAVNLYMELAGPNGAGTDYDLVVCQNEVNLNNFGLEVYFINGYNPGIGDSFQLLTGGISGDIVNPYINLPALDTGLEWVYVNNGSSITISVQVTVAISLSSFDVEEVRDGNELRWQTEMEIDHDYFIIEKSVNETRWDEIGRVDGLGYSNSLSTYKFLDKEPSCYGNYYRLVSVDNQGFKEYSDVLHVVSQTLCKIKIWPKIVGASNQNIIHVENLKEGNYHISLMNSAGSLVKWESYLDSGNNVIPISQALTKGLYFIQIKNELISFTDSFYLD